MVEALVGAGGWGYFTGGLGPYAMAFRFVEVNASFYRPVPESFARRWRARVPPDFTFSVKAYRGVSHADRLRATAPARAAFAHDVRIAKILRAPFLIVETPSDLALETDQIAGLRELAAIADGGPRLGLEARAHRSGPLPASLRVTMEDLAVLDVVDLSQSPPRIEDDTVYTRLFGPGPHNVYEFDDDELRQIDRAGQDAVQVAFTFHGVRMYKDAARFVSFKRTGSFPAATGGRGLASLDEVLRPDAAFPATRDALVRDQGWKVVDTDEGTRVHASRYLEALPDRTYRSLDEVLGDLGRSETSSPHDLAKTGPETTLQRPLKIL